MTRHINLALVAIAVAVGTCHLGAESRALTVCQAIDSGGDRQEVLVQGELAGSKRHGVVLSQGIKLDPCPGWPRLVFTAPSMIPLALSSLGGVVVTAEEQAANQVFYNSLPAETGSAHVHVTVKGVLIRRERLAITRAQDGTYSGPGFEGDQEYFLTLVVKSIAKDATQ